ncbi:hypothetical protein ACUN0C_18780 [Faunimonas sp. B44]|uniref:hypothetical protein n=1 Tax=Faunimonas sp. B44 TaxID=3461493 RepID=UPI004043E1E5
MIVLNKQEVADLMITAIEGGSTYWLESCYLQVGTTTEKPWYADPDLYRQDFTLRLEFDGEVDVLTKNKLEKAEGLMPRERLGRVLCGEYDAEDADVFLQLALFGEVVYG